nr:variable surface lipoprotein [Mycoplasmopsis bovis]
MSKCLRGIQKFMKHKLLLSLGTVLTATFSFPLIAS